MAATAKVSDYSETNYLTSAKVVESFLGFPKFQTDSLSQETSENSPSKEKAEDKDIKT